MNIHDVWGTIKTDVLGGPSNTGYAFVRGADLTGNMVLSMTYPTAGIHSVTVDINGYYETAQPLRDDTVYCASHAYYTINVLLSSLGGGGGGGCGTSSARCV